MLGSLGTEKQAGRQERVEELFRAYAPAVLAYALRRGVQLADADDIVAETFLVCYQRMAEVPGEPLPWLVGVARKMLSHHYRAERRRHALESRLCNAAIEAGRLGSEHRLQHGPAFDAYMRLSPREQEILRMIVLEDLGGRVVAQNLALTRKAVYGRLARARTRLKACLRDAPR